MKLTKDRDLRRQRRDALRPNPVANQLIREFDLVVINMAPHHSQCYVEGVIDNLGLFSRAFTDSATSQCYVEPAIDNLAGSDWELINRLGPERYFREGAALAKPGLYLHLPPFGAQLFHCCACTKEFNRS